MREYRAPTEVLNATIVLTCIVKIKDGYCISKILRKWCYMILFSKEKRIKTFHG